MAEGGEDRSQLIAHFQEVTGIDDHDKCLQVLSSHVWNLEAAIQDTLNEKEGINPVFSSPSIPPSSGKHTDSPTLLPSPVDLPGNEGVRRRVQEPSRRVIRIQQRGGRVLPRHQSWWDWMINLALLPLQFTVTAATDLYNFIMNMLFGFQPHPARDPKGDVQQFITEFEAKYGQQHPLFLTCGYDEALSRVRGDLQFLLVYLHSPGHQDTDSFCREVLSSQQLIDFVAERMLVWGVSVMSEEGARVSYILRESSYPFLALIVLKQSRIVVCERIEGSLGVEALIARLLVAVSNDEAELVVERNERFRRLADQQLRQDQDQAYLESLTVDREKERKRKEAQQQEEAEVQQHREMEMEEEKRKEEFEIDRTVRVSRLPLEPDVADPLSIYILIRLPSGHRMERRFKETDKLESLYDFAHSAESGLLPMKFTLVSNFPRKELHPDSDGGPQLVDLELGKRCALYIHNDVEED